VLCSFLKEKEKRLARARARTTSKSFLEWFYFEKIRVFQASKLIALNTLAWNNKIGLGFLFVLLVFVNQSND